MCVERYVKKEELYRIEKRTKRKREISGVKVEMGPNSDFICCEHFINALPLSLYKKKL